MPPVSAARVGVTEQSATGQSVTEPAVADRLIGPRLPPVPGPARLQVADVLRAHLDAYLAERGDRICVQELKTLCWLDACRTEKLGQHSWICETCGAMRHDYNSCRNRHCPTCSGMTRRKWLERLQPRLLPVPCFQVVFTLPRELSQLGLANRAEIYDLLFRASWEALQELGVARHQAKLAAIAFLHTWSQTMDHHPHLHMVVPAGGLSLDGKRWVPFVGLRTKDGKQKKPYLVDVHALGALFRGKFLAGLRELWQAGALQLGGKLAELSERAGFESFLSRLHEKSWVVYSQPPPSNESGADGVLKYLARYVAGVAISDSRLISHEDGWVTFWARPAGHDAVAGATSKGKKREARPFRLPGVEFVRRFAMHILPKGFTRVRYFGLYSNAQREQRACCQNLLRPPQDSSPTPASTPTAEAPSAASASAPSAASVPPAASAPSAASSSAASASSKLGPLCPHCQKGHLRLVPTSIRPPTWRELVARRLRGSTSSAGADESAGEASMRAWARGAPWPPREPNSS